MAQLVSLAIRTLHVLTMAVFVGASLALWYGYRTGALDVPSPAIRYEWTFWGTIALIVATGVGNLGALGVPGPATGWGRTLLVKLLVVVALVAGSAVRTLAMVRLGECDAHRSAHRRLCSRAYGATTGALVVVVLLAEVLAHG